MTKTDDRSANDRSAVGNEKRLQAENAKRLLQKANKATVQHALKNIDSGGLGLNKKVVFPEDSDDDTPSNPSKVHGKDSMQLFGADSDESSNDEPSFHVRDQFEGADGERLFALQSRFNNDERFKVDKRFLENDEFSPDNEESRSEIEIDNTPTESKQSTDSPSKEESYFAVSKNISDLFGKKSEKPRFSMISQPEPTEDKSHQLIKSSAKIDNSTRFPPRKHQPVLVNPFKPNGWFFLNPGDESVMEGCRSFCRHGSEEDIRSKWANGRPIVLEIFRKMRKNKGRTLKKKSNKFKL